MANKELVEQLMQFFFKHEIKIKMYHFQTKQYGSHKTSDAYLAQYLLDVDRFMEVAQGAFGIIETKKMKLEIMMESDESIDHHLEKYIKFLKDLGKNLNDYPALINVKDDMLSNVQQFRYLLTFK